MNYTLSRSRPRLALSRVLIALVAVVVGVGGLAPVASAAAPPAPEGVAVSVDDGLATLQWSVTPGAGGYNVYRNDHYLTTTTSTSHRDRPGSGVHTYYVTAFDDTREFFGPRSAEVRADTSQPEPVAPDPVDDGGGAELRPPTLDRIETVPGAAVLHFATDDGAAGYNVYRNDRYVATTSSSPYRDDASPGTHTYYLVGFDGSGARFSDRSAEVTVDTRGVSTVDEDSGPDGARIPNPPSFIEVVKKPSFVSVVWRLDGSRRGVNVYRNNRFIGSVNSPGTVFNDRAGRLGDTYHLVAYGENDTFSAPSPRANAVADVTGTPDRPGVAAVFPLSVRAESSSTLLSWAAQPGNPQYSVYRFRTSASSSEVSIDETITGSTSFRAPRASNDLYLVAVLDGENVVAATGLHDWTGACVALCTTEQWVGSRQTRAVPVIVIGVIVREAARRAAQWCAADAQRCVSFAQDVVNAGIELYDAFIEDNPASVIASQQVDDLVDDGFVVTSENESTSTMTLQNGDTTVTIQTVETDPGEAGNIVTTTTTLNSDGQVATIRVELDRVSERLLDDAPQIDSNYTSIRTNLYDLLGNLVGARIHVYVDGQLVGTDCEGYCGPSPGDGAPPADDSPFGGLGDSDGDGTPDFLDEDDDGDGIPDTIDAEPDVPFDPDTDGDGTPNSEDWDDDGDGIPDVIDPQPLVPHEDDDEDEDDDDDDDEPGPCEGSMDAAAGC